MIVTIARSYGSGGKEIGKTLAKMLEINYYGRELLEMSNGDDGDILFGCDESFQNSSFEKVDEQFRMQSDAIRSIAEKESCVIVGRCADYVLRDRDDAAKVYLFAPQRECMRRIIRLYELNPDEAKSLIHSMNKTRGDYYYHNTGQIWSDLTHYDLCINTAGLEHEQCAELIINYLKLKTLI